MPDPSFFARFRTRLVLLILLAVLPAFGLVLYGNFEQRRIEKARVCEGATAIARLAAATQEHFIDDARQLLTTLTQFPFLVLGTNRAFCEQNFANLRNLAPDYLNFGLIETNGICFCSATSTNVPINAGDRSYFQRVVQTRQFSAGDFQIGRHTGQKALNFGFPVLNEHGELQRVLYASLKLSRLSEAMINLGLPPRATLMVLDRNGNVLARQSQPEKWVGNNLSDTPLVQKILAGKSTVFEMPGLDGVPCLHAVRAGNDGQQP